MNIFAVSSSQVECAEALDDRRLNKMILETAQLLCTSIVYAAWMGPMPPKCQSKLYSPTHEMHPCTQWAMASPENWAWLYELWLAYLDEWYRRKPTNPVHGTDTRLRGCLTEVYDRLASLNRIMAPSEHRVVGTPFPNCTTFKHYSDTFEAYRNTLNLKWDNDIRNHNFPKWTRRGAPEWRVDNSDKEIIKHD